VGAPGDPVEGSNVTLICGSFYSLIDYPPTWFYYDKDFYHQLKFKRTKGKVTLQTFPEILRQQPHAGSTTFCQRIKIKFYLLFISIAASDISIKLERKWDDLYFYKSQLKLHSVSLKTPYTKFKCVNDLIERETSFTIKGNYIKRQSNGR
jgi:hypothetical protein